MKKYNYDIQAWTDDDIVLKCGHPDAMRPGCCTAGKYYGILAKHAAQLMDQSRQVRAGSLPDNMKRTIYAAIDYTIEEIRRDQLKSNHGSGTYDGAQFTPDHICKTCGDDITEQTVYDQCDPCILEARYTDAERVKHSGRY